MDEHRELGSTLKSRHVSMITIGGIIGAGLFVGSSTTISLAGPAATLSYAFAGLIILFVMRMLSEVAANVPGVQTFTDFARLGMGHWAGFMTGWLYWYFWIVVIAIEAIAGAKILNAWLPEVPVWQIGVALLLLLTLINLMSTRMYGEFEFWFALTKVVAIVAFILVTLAWTLGIGHGGGPTFANLTRHGGFMPNGFGIVLASITSTIFALCGAEIATIAAAESEDSMRAVSRLTMSVTLRIMIFFVGSVGLITATVPWNTIRPGYSPFASALAEIGIPGGDSIMSLVVLVAVLSCLNSGLYVTSRTLFALAKERDAPSWLVRVNRRRVPVRAIVAASLFSYGALAAEHLYPDTIFSFLVNSSGAVMLILYLLIAAAQLRIRSRLELTQPQAIKLKMWFHPYGTLAAIAAMVSVLVAMATTDGLRIQFWASFGVTILVLLAFGARKMLLGAESGEFKTSQGKVTP